LTENAKEGGELGGGGLEGRNTGERETKTALSSLGLAREGLTRRDSEEQLVRKKVKKE